MPSPCPLQQLVPRSPSPVSSRDAQREARFRCFPPGLGAAPRVSLPPLQQREESGRERALQHALFLSPPARSGARCLPLVYVGSGTALIYSNGTLRWFAKSESQISKSRGCAG